MNLFILIFGLVIYQKCTSAYAEIIISSEHLKEIEQRAEDDLLENLMNPENLAKIFGPQSLESVPIFNQENQEYLEAFRDVEDINFVLYTSDKPYTGVQIIADKPALLRRSGFVKNATTKIICHGFMSDYLQGPGKYLLPAYLEMDGPGKKLTHPMNFILINWANMAGIHKTEPPPTPAPGANASDYDISNSALKQWYDIFYFPPARNTELVGNETAKLIKFLLKHGEITLDQIHLIGHSLGAHAMGYAGKNLNSTINQKVSRLTALDPAGPCFESFSLFCLRGRFRHVNKADAMFVDVIHTHARALGMKSPVGHVDFYPNGGFYQPECHWITFGMCSHRRSIELLAESIEASRFNFLAHKCSSWSSFSKGNCRATDFALLGEYCSRKASGVYFLSTTKEPSLTV